MRLKTLLALLGALIAAVIIGGIFAFLMFSWITFTVIASLAVVGYIVAAIAANPLTKTTAFGEIMRGFLVGLNASANFVVAFALVQTLAGTIGGVVAGATLGALNLVTAIGPLSRTSFFQGVVGYVNWLMPMSWPVIGLGFLFMSFSYLLHAVTIGKVRYLKVEGVRMDWKTCTLFFKGGLIANLNYADSAFNMGNFAFVDYQSADSNWHMDHESGHTLNLMAFGWIFHLIGALDENATPRGVNALSERIAESYDSGSSGSNIPMWA
jgi:hypothetical protein